MKENLFFFFAKTYELVSNINKMVQNKPSDMTVT